MPTPYDRATWPVAPPGRPPARPPLRRSVTDRRVAGVCSGIATHVGVSTTAARWVTLAVVILSGGAALAVYVFLWALVPEESDLDGGYRVGPGAPSGPASAPTAGIAAPTSGLGAAVRDGRWGRLVGVGVLVLLIGLATTAQSYGFDIQAGILVPLLVIAAGAIVAWSHLDEADRESWLGEGPGTRRLVSARVGLGVGLAVVGILVLTTHGQSPTVIWDALLAVVAVLAGVVIIAAPWAVRIWSDVRLEQVAAARATERADIAAHLHDSVLQTLALIQRRSTDPVAVTQLARAQERELRTWLYAGPSGSGDSLAAAVAEAAHEVEDLHAVPVDLVVTGDRPLEPHGMALTRALREALLNAVRHGRPPVTAYVEIGPSGVSAYVRDHGDGFDIDGIPADRLGVRESILARLGRHGGFARVRRREDGIEVELTLPPIEGDQP